MSEQQWLQRRLALCIVGLVSACFVIACGGGGGGEGGTVNGGSTAPPSSSTGLVPQAAAPGPTLYARGTDVRPVRAGAQWVYHRNDYESGNALDIRSVAVAGSAGQVLETTSDDVAHPTTVSVDADGSVRTSAVVALSSVHSFTASGFELRSPVRQGDQYVLFDAGVPNIDADGDGRSDVVQVALWRTVIGNESVNLPNRPVPTTALRVDNFATVRITPSSGGAAQQATASTTSWYEPGVGVVRQTVASTSPSRAFDAEDVLTGWDGVTEGRGYLTQPAQYISSSSGDPVRSAETAVGLADGALMLGASGMHRLDRNGVVQESFPSPFTPSPTRLMRSSAGVRLLSGNWPTVQLHALDNQGHYLSPLASLDFTDQRPDTLAQSWWAQATHPSSPLMWVAWQRTAYVIATASTANSIVLRAISDNGASPFPELSFTANQAVDVSSIRLDAQADGATITWHEYDTSGAITVRVAKANNAGSQVFSTTPLNLLSNVPAFRSFVRPLSDGTTTWLMWLNNTIVPPFGTYTQTSHGVALDASGNLMGLAGSSDLSAVVDANFIDWPAGVVSDAGHLFATGTSYGLAFPNDRYTTTVMTYADFAVGTGPLAASITKSASYRVPDVNKSSSVDPIVFPDRVLILSQTGGYFLRPTVIWR